jgi:hypothetical protein
LLSEWDTSIYMRDMFLNERLLEKVGDAAQLIFTHDMVHQAVMDLFVNKSEQPELHFHLGMELYRRYFENHNEESSLLEANDSHLLFLCADRLNSGIKAIDENLPHFRLKLCRLNFEAAKKAADLAAFEHAFAYCQNGLELLPNESCWEQHYHLALGLNTLDACMCLPTGHDKALRSSVELVVQHARGIEDSTDAWFTLLQFLRDRGIYEEMGLTAYSILESIGDALPRDPSDKAALVEFKRVTARLESKTDEEILNLRSIDKYPLKDFCLFVCLFVCSSIYQGLMHFHSSAVRVFFACRMMDFTLEYGLGGTSASAFGCFQSCCLSEYFETRVAARAGNLALAYNKSRNMKLRLGFWRLAHLHGTNR